MNPVLKFVLSILVIVTIGMGALWILGGKKQRVSTSLTINAPADVVFSFVKDAKASESWISGMVDVEPVPSFDNDGEGNLGTRFRYAIENDGSRVEFLDEVMRFEEDVMYSNRSTARLFTQISVINLNDKKDGTTYLSYRIKRANRKIGRLLNAFSNPPLKDKIQNDARRLKELSEEAFAEIAANRKTATAK